MAEKIKTGIDGLDKALFGGIPKGNLVLVAGGAGTGKSSLCMQYLVNGAKSGEKGLYISTEQNREELLKAAREFGLNVEDFERKGMVQIAFLDVPKQDNFFAWIKRTVSAFQPSRIVVDSMTALADTMMVHEMKSKGSFTLVQVVEDVFPTTLTEKLITKNLLYSLITDLKSFGATTLLTTELPEQTEFLSADGMSEFIADGVLKLEYLGVGASVFRTLRIRKMRYTDHEKGSLYYEMTPGKGVEVKKQEIGL
jgi:circadian clock protein KaiC